MNIKIFVFCLAAFVQAAKDENDLCEKAVKRLKPGGSMTKSQFWFRIVDSELLWTRRQDDRFGCHPQCLLPHVHKGFWYNREYKMPSSAMYHPYLNGQTGAGEAALRPIEAGWGLRCPKRGDVESSNRGEIRRFANLGSVRKLVNTSLSQNLLHTWDQYDLRDIPNACYGAPCPLLLKIFSRKFRNPLINGYYVMNSVFRDRHVVTYKHITRNIYIWSDKFDSKALNSGKRVYYVSSYPGRFAPGQKDHECAEWPMAEIEASGIDPAPNELGVLGETKKLAHVSR